MRQLIVGTFALGLLVAGCDDGEDGDVDSGMLRDAGRPVDAGRLPDAGGGGEDAGPADAGGPTTYVLALTTAAEVPVCASAGGSASGAATVTISADGSTIQVTDVSFTGLSGAATGAHIHFADVGVAGPVILPLAYAPPADETFTAADYPSPVPSGAPATFAAFVEAMRDGMTYINVHTADCMPGEIRAQIE